MRCKEPPRQVVQGFKPPQEHGHKPGQVRRGPRRTKRGYLMAPGPGQGDLPSEVRRSHLVLPQLAEPLAHVDTHQRAPSYLFDARAIAKGPPNTALELRSATQ